MKIRKNIPYTYLIGWPDLDKWYYGVRYAKNCNPNDLWVTYKTSSKIVHNFVINYGEPSVIQVRKTHSSVKTAQSWENRVLKKLKVANSSKWLNGHDSTSFDPSLVPKGDLHWTRQDTERAKKWRDRSGWKLKGGHSKGNAPSGDQHWTRQNSESAQKHHIRMTNNNPNNQLEVKQKKSDYLKKNNPVNLPGVREKIRNTLLGKKRPRKICDFCNTNVADSIYTRYHGNKCKHKNTPTPSSY